MIILWDSQGHNGPANRAQERVDIRGHAAISVAPFGLIGSGTCPSCDGAAIEEHSNRPVPGEPSLEMLVEMRAIACDDNELPNHLRWAVGPFRRITAPRMTRRRGLRQEPRERGPRRAPAGWARRGANFKTLVAIKTQGHLSQREMHPRRKHSATVVHRHMTAGTSTGPSEPVVATVASV